MTHRFGMWAEPDDDDDPPYQDDGLAEWEYESFLDDQSIEAAAALSESRDLAMADDAGLIDLLGRPVEPDHFESCYPCTGDYSEEGGICPECGNMGWVLA